MNEHRYILQPYKGMKTRYTCPECNDRDKTFVRYIDTETGEHLADHVGRCNRESNCNYHYTPKQYFQDSGKTFDTPRPNIQPKRIVTPAKPVSFIPVNTFKHSLKSYESNHLITHLLNLFDTAITNRLIETYFIGTSKYWQGATVFWQIDTQGKIRTGKIMLYSPATGKRVKEPFNHITWVHAALKQPEFELKQCFFGEYLLKLHPANPVAIVESEKTAIIASVYLPLFIWIATGGKNGCKWHSLEVAKVLQGRNVTLFPDLNCFDTWSDKAKELSHVARFNVSGLLEHKATVMERQQGLDLADYLIKFDYREFILPTPSPAIEPLTEAKGKQQVDNFIPPTGKNIAYVDATGKLFIPTPLAETYTIYASVSDYNNRANIQEFVKKQSVDITHLNPVFIDLKTLTIEAVKKQ